MVAFAEPGASVLLQPAARATSRYEAAPTPRFAERGLCVTVARGAGYPPLRLCGAGPLCYCSSLSAATRRPPPPALRSGASVLL